MRIREGERERVQTFEGVVIRRQGRGPGVSFTVRRVTHGIGVERTFPSTHPGWTACRWCATATYEGPSSTT